MIESYANIGWLPSVSVSSDCEIPGSWNNVTIDERREWRVASGRNTLQFVSVSGLVLAPGISGVSVFLMWGWHVGHGSNHKLLTKKGSNYRRDFALGGPERIYTTKFERVLYLSWLDMQILEKESYDTYL